MAALGDHVGIAARIFDPSPLPFEGNHRGDRAIEEVAVVAHEKQGPGIACEHLLQEVERLEVEVVGGLVQHEQVGGTRQRHGQDQPPPLAPR